MKNIDFTPLTFGCFVVLALLGALLRYMFCFPTGLNYVYILHAHSHFAFAWIFLALAVLLAKQVSKPVASAFNWVFLATIACSFAMLISFSLQGYKVISIIFSTLFLLITYRFGYLIYRRWAENYSGLFPTKLVKAGIGFLFLSSLGPLSLGVLKANGNTGVIYQNAIYFYLHFQLNGWMLFAALALIAVSYLKVSKIAEKQIVPWLNVFILSAIPLFFIFTLWSKPPLWLFFIAFAGAFANALSWFMMLRKLKFTTEKLPLLVKMALIAISLKVIFQVLVCIPQIANWTFMNRNLIIGYIHLISLGSVTPIIINQFVKSGAPQYLKAFARFYCSVTILYLVLLFLQPLLNQYAIPIPYFQYILLFISLLFCISGVFYYSKLSGSRQPNTSKDHQFQSYSQ